MGQERDSRLGLAAFGANRHGSQILPIGECYSPDSVHPKLCLGGSQRREEKRRGFLDELKDGLAKEGLWVVWESAVTAALWDVALGQQQRLPMFVASCSYSIKAVFARMM